MNILSSFISCRKKYYIDMRCYKMREREAWTMNGIIGIILGSGITIIQPNQSVVVIFLGKYMGSIREEGIVITVPFSIRRTISLRVRNFNSKRLKVNDVNGNPIEIAAVIVFRVVDSAKAVFDVDHYKKFV